MDLKERLDRLTNRQKELLIKRLGDLEEGPGRKQIACYFEAGEPVDPSELGARLRERLPDYMVPTKMVQVEELPRLPNGKIDKKALSQLTTSNVSSEDFEGQNPMEEKLLRIWRSVLDNDRVGRKDNFFSIGGDSISSIRIISQARMEGMTISPDLIFKYQTVEELTPFVTIEESNETTPEVSYFLGESELTPIQRWYFEEHREFSHYWNQALQVDLKRPVKEEVIEGLAKNWMERHPALRQTFAKKEGKWVSHYRPINSCCLKIANEEAFIPCQEQMSLGKGPLFLVVWVDDSSGSVRSFRLLAHHLVIDLVSWSVLLQELSIYLQDPTKWGASSGPGYQNWAELITSDKVHKLFQGEKAFWQEQLASPFLAEAKGREKDIHRQRLEINEELTQQMMGPALDAYGLEVVDLLIHAYVSALQEVLSPNALTVWLEKHGRKPLTEADFSTSVGWFTSFYPLKLEPSQDLETSIVDVKEKLRQVPNEGVGYGYWRYVKAEASLSGPAQFLFNYSGVADSAEDSAIAKTEFIFEDVRHPEVANQSVVEWNGSIEKSRLVVIMGCNQQLINSKQRLSLVSAFEKHLEQAVNHCLTADKKYTPSDFPDAGLSSDDLGALFDQL